MSMLVLSDKLGLFERRVRMNFRRVFKPSSLQRRTLGSDRRLEVRVLGRRHCQHGLVSHSSPEAANHQESRPLGSFTGRRISERGLPLLATWRYLPPVPWPVALVHGTHV